MKTLLSLSLLFFLLAISTIHGQEQFTVNGKQYILKTEAEGTITLLWNTIEGEYRYFSKKGLEIQELKNSRIDGKYQEEYKQVLKMQTSDRSISVDKVKLTLNSLKDFYNDYNSSVDPNYSVEKKSIQLKTRLGAFVGVSNNIFARNPEITSSPTAGIDFEIFEQANLVRHSLVIQFKQTFENSSYKYSVSQFSLNYRFKFVKTETFNMYINTKFAEYYHWVTTISGGGFQAPVTFGLGADYALGNGYITFSYNDIVGLGIDNNGKFPIDFSLGYKINL